MIMDRLQGEEKEEVEMMTITTMGMVMIGDMVSRMIGEIGTNIEVGSSFVPAFHTVSVASLHQQLPSITTRLSLAKPSKRDGQ